MVHVSQGFNRTTVRRNVESAIRSLLSFDNQSFGSGVTIGQIYRATLGVQGVEWADLNWLSGDKPTESDELQLDTEGYDYRKVENWNPDTNSYDSLLIPRIDPNDPWLDNEFPKDFPDYTNPSDPNALLPEDERPSDGLWVKALGGLANT